MTPLSEKISTASGGGLDDDVAQILCSQLDVCQKIRNSLLLMLLNKSHAGMAGGLKACPPCTLPYCTADIQASVCD